MTETPENQPSNQPGPQPYTPTDPLDYRVDPSTYSKEDIEFLNRDGKYWANKTLEERFEGIERNRRIVYGEAANGRMDKSFFEVVQGPKP